MDLKKHLAGYFFESAVNNAIVNLGITFLFFLFVQHNTGMYLIPLLFLFNTAWVIAYLCINYVENSRILITSARGKALMVFLIVFYVLCSFFLMTDASRKLFVISNTVLGFLVLFMYLLKKPLEKGIIKRLQKDYLERRNIYIINKLKNYPISGFSNKFYQPSLSVLQTEKIHTLSYNSEKTFPGISRVSLNAEMQMQEALENAEYTFGNINFGDTLAADWFAENNHSYRFGKLLQAKQLANKILKRGFDIFISLLVIVFFLSWMVPVIGLLIKLQSRGPVFFKQLRSGKNNKAFWCYKFRSMHINEKSDELQAVKGDNRITAIGAFLRKTSIDEFPQFINVLKGEMSIVGPRPHMLLHTEYYGSKIDHYMKRLAVRQGLTGWAQVKGYRGETKDIKSMEERVRHDLWYMQNWNFWLDIKIIFMTFKDIFGAKPHIF